MLSRVGVRIRGFCIHRAPGTELGFDEWSRALFYLEWLQHLVKYLN